MAGEYEYKLIGGYMVFYVFFIFLIGLTGGVSLSDDVSSPETTVSELTETSGISFWSTFKAGLKNPFEKGGIVAVLYGFVILSPMILIASMMGLNYVRGR